MQTLTCCHWNWSQHELSQCSWIITMSMNYHNICPWIITISVHELSQYLSMNYHNICPWIITMFINYHNICPWIITISVQELSQYLSMNYHNVHELSQCSRRLTTYKYLHPRKSSKHLMSISDKVNNFVIFQIFLITKSLKEESLGY